jgi:hypothetical protein
MRKTEMAKIMSILEWDEDKYPTRWFHADGTEF